MSIVSDFARSCATQAFAMIGEEPVVIGATTLQCVLAEVDDAKDFSGGGFEVIKTLQAVCRTADMPAASILKKTATARSLTFRVEGVRKGADFTTITLEQVEKA
jgi:hypothetical protein